MLADGKVKSFEKGEMAMKLIELKFDEADVLGAVEDCATMDLAIAYLQQECELCLDKFPAKKVNKHKLILRRNFADN